MKSILHHLWMLVLILLAHGPFAYAQSQLTTTPNASPKAWVGQTIGLTDVKVVYHRPAVKDRTVWGNLVPMDAVWRAGANDNTVIKFSTDVKIEGETLKAGVYGLHIIPSEKESTIIFSKNSTAWGSYSYTPEEDALRVKVKNADAEHFYEVLTFEFENHTNSSAVCKPRVVGKGKSPEHASGRPTPTNPSSADSLSRPLRCAPVPLALLTEIPRVGIGGQPAGATRHHADEDSESMSRRDAMFCGLSLRQRQPRCVQRL